MLIVERGKTNGQRKFSGRRVLIRTIREKISDASSLVEYMADNTPEGFTENEWQMLMDISDEATGLGELICKMYNLIR